MTYKDAIIKEMEDIAKDPNSVFLGYNVKFGSQAYGTLSTIPKDKLIETPLAENLMTGLATGLSLQGYKPVLFFERHDFLLNASDAIVNHVDKLEKLSHDDFNTPMIIRATVGGRIPLDPGLQHIQDYTEAFRRMVSFPVLAPQTEKEVTEAYDIAKQFIRPIMIVEKRDLYTK